MKKSIAIPISLLFFCLCISGISLAQEQYGNIRGKVTDTSDEPLPDVSVEVGEVGHLDLGRGGPRAADRLDLVVPVLDQRQGRRGQLGDVAEAGADRESARVHLVLCTGSG